MAITDLASIFTNPLVQPSFVVALNTLILSTGFILSQFRKKDRSQDENGIQKFKEGQIFDFIVVGGGSAGGVVANRLSRAGHSVLLLEAGGDPHPLQLIPAFLMFFLNYPETDHMYRSVPQKWGSLNSVNQQSSWSAGKGLGGSGTINIMIHLRGHRKDFDNWANLTGDPSWSWEGVLPFFKSYEDYEVPGDPVNHGYGGDLRIESPSYIGLAREFVAAGGELGYPNVDLNAPFTEGFDQHRTPIKNGQRQASYKAFIEPILTLPSLTLLRYAHVNRVLIRNGNEAYGVQFDRHGKTYTALASKEIIMSAGAVGSPRILLSSGIGPRDHLSDMGIPLVRDLPVGRNLQDHLGVYLSPFILREPRSMLVERDITPKSMIEWFTKGIGVLTWANSEASGIISTDIAKLRGEGDWPDIQYFLLSLGLMSRTAQVLSHAFNQKLDEMQRYYEGLLGNDAVHVVVSGTRPLSRGYLKLGGTSPYDKPIIDPRYLSDPEDVDLRVLLEGVKKCLHLIENTTVFGEALGARFAEKKLPGCEHLRFRSDSYWECFVRRNSVTLHHFAGSVSMGKVVDTELKVLGVRNLRVIDASVQPVIVITNTQASTLMIAEKGSHMILMEWSQKSHSRASRSSSNVQINENSI